MYKLFLEVFPEIAPNALAILSTIVGAVLEMLGYVGAIEFVHSIFRLVRSRSEKYWLTVGLTGIAYLFYLVSMLLINVQLGKYFGTPPIVNSIVGLLSFITVPTGLLAANYLGGKSESEIDYTIRQERREDRIKTKMIKAGMNPNRSFQSEAPAPTQAKNKGDWRNLSPDEQRQVVNVLSVQEIMSKYPVSRATAYKWKKMEV
jgi:hypothetical protein